MAHKVTYAALTATAVIAAIDAQMQFVAELLTPRAYSVTVAIVAIAGIAVNAWKDYQTTRGHDG